MRIDKNRVREAKKSSYLSILSNSLIAIAKGTAGILGASFALIADAIESATDVFTSLLLILGINYATRPADHNHPYGHGKAETLITFIIVGFLVISSIFIAYQSIENIRSDSQEIPEPYTLVVLAAVVIIKEVLYRIQLRNSKKTKSSSINADAWHHRSDAVTSLAAFIGISISILMGPGYEKAEDWSALFASAFILYNAYMIFRPALGELMDEDLHKELVNEVRNVAEKVEGVENTEKCFIRKSGMFHHVDLHVRVDGEITVTEGHDIAHMLKDKLLDDIPEISDVLIHIEPN